ncbi:iron(III) transport system substrate-binding protein [Noviherbaspirillum humi]|uniref:Iron(III) transport system substrate-binding protein n=1 Tax=Noviherbaspirillum humi TaxID=1688639 RepID=A0A239DSP2_9BURK|nr:extracellular solute-binding protein [Noviherbaspirillum humi]SNS34763.1 iron(III) transport system substrate-binding protein [Noviherbaspirillum humi]
MSLFSRFTPRRRVLTAALALALSAAAGSVPAQNAGRNDAVFQYRGADRDQKLVEKAKQEGTVTLYTSLAPSESMPLANAFEKKYGIKVELWRAVSEKVVQRTVTEGKARRYAVDVIETNAPEVEMIAREKLTAEFFSPYLADLPPGAIPSHRLWVSDRLNYFVVAYNTAKIKREDLPNSYEGFADPKWKGRLGIEATDSEWMAAMVKKLGAERGAQFFDKLSELRPDVRKGHILLTELVAAGEVPVALTVYNSVAESLKRRGAPIDWAPIEPVIARPQALGVARNAPHPHAALLFADYVLSPEGQELLKSMGRIPASTKVKSELNNFPSTMIDVGEVLDESEKWERKWSSLFLKRQ